MSTEKAVTTAALKAALKLGALNGQSVETLASMLDTTPRAVRKLADELIEEGTPVCAHPSTGYYIAQTQAEVDAVAEFLRQRGLHSLTKAKHLRDAFAGATPVDFDQLEQEGAFGL
ncbi:MAG: hypothetical protein A3H93_09100 [Rhodocyclales bacterium RIFCSPLOWO2_02_FULL_63_24]|nr:MAG: hypothetical protein A3H93_09100 [Rhodocyclales bacterium RIFCSPLOWO2_02_FULL_63_24]